MSVRPLFEQVLESPERNHAIEAGRSAISSEVRARDLFDLALAIDGQGSLQKDLRVELVPTIETSLGPIRYPAPVVVRRSAAPR